MPSRVSTHDPAKRGTIAHSSHDGNINGHTIRYTNGQSNRSYAPKTYWVFNLDDIYNSRSRGSNTPTSHSQSAENESKLNKSHGTCY